MAKLDIRARTQEDWKSLVEEVRAIVEEEDIPGTRGSLRVYNHRPAMEPTPATEALVATIRRAAAVLGQQVEFAETMGGSDASFSASLGIPSLDGFGPRGGNTMTRDEYIDLQSLVDQTALLALTLTSLVGADEA